MMKIYRVEFTMTDKIQSEQMFFVHNV